ncbi:hypothetical protein GW17_00035914 [Ensete ventricosum]|nr:hypothetical protein GW17_00035914 [Ensete ventricosum]
MLCFEATNMEVGLQAADRMGSSKKGPAIGGCLRVGCDNEKQWRMGNDNGRGAKGSIRRSMVVHGWATIAGSSGGWVAEVAEEDGVAKMAAIGDQKVATGEQRRGLQDRTGTEVTEVGFGASDCCGRGERRSDEVAAADVGDGREGTTAMLGRGCVFLLSGKAPYIPVRQLTGTRTGRYRAPSPPSQPVGDYRPRVRTG